MKKYIFVFSLFAVLFLASSFVLAQDTTSTQTGIVTNNPTGTSQNCVKDSTKKYTCPDGTEVGWCTCADNGVWVCVNSPEIGCSKCNQGQIKQYTCPDGTKVNWCNCGNNGTWACINSPENGCPVAKTCPAGCTCYNNGLSVCPMTNNENSQKTTIKSDNIEATSSEKIKVVENKLYIESSSGKNSEVKIMPETASAKAIEKLGEVKNVKIELKQVGNGDTAKPAYQVSAQKEVKLLGMFKVKMTVNTQVNSETGEAVKMQKPWWSFLVW